jgi:hypothetical protein
MVEMPDGGGGDLELNTLRRQQMSGDSSAIFPLGNENTESLLRARIFTLLRSPRIDSKESFPPVCVLCRLAGRYKNPIPTRILASIDCLKIPALALLYSAATPMYFVGSHSGSFGCC